MAFLSTLLKNSPRSNSSYIYFRNDKSVAIPPAIHRSAFWGFAESAPASAFGVLFGDSQKVPRRVPPRVPGKLGVLPRVLFLGKE